MKIGCIWIFVLTIIFGVAGNEFPLSISLAFMCWLPCYLIIKLFKSTKGGDNEEAEKNEKKEPGTISFAFQTADAQKDDKSEDLFNNLSKRNFENLRDAAYKLADYGLSLCKKSSVLSKLNIVMDILDKNQQPVETKEKVIYTLFTDAYKCYTHLDGKLNSKKSSGLALLLFGNRVLVNDSCISYEELELFHVNNFDLCATYYDRMYELTQKQGMFPSSIFYFEYVLEDNEMLEERAKYLSLLYKFTSAIVSAFDLHNEKTRGWMSVLSSLMKGNTSLVGSMPSEHEGNCYQQLYSLIGLQCVKDEVSKLVSFIKVQQQREKSGMKTSAISHHFVFTGNPGTGKTTVARIIAGIYEDLGIIHGGQLIETDRSGLVAEYVGQTAVKTNKVIDSALDGVLFIDEAYSLAKGSKEDFGYEAIATLLKRMEDERDRLIVILAGYEDEMQQFIESNPGLQSRFNRYIRFDDYKVDELMDIFLRNVEKQEYKLEDSATATLRETIEQAIMANQKNFGNARFVRNLFEKIIEIQAIRLANIDNPTAEQLSLITSDDIKRYNL